jgi:hypothetical protein
MTRVHTEIVRSFYHQKNCGGHQPYKAYLTGELRNMLHMKEFLQEKLDMPVEIIDL